MPTAGASSTTRPAAVRSRTRSSFARCSAADAVASRVALPVLLDRQHALRADGASRREERRDGSGSDDGYAERGQASLGQEQRHRPVEALRVDDLDEDDADGDAEDETERRADAGPDRAFGGDDGENLASCQAE